MDTITQAMFDRLAEDAVLDALIARAVDDATRGAIFTVIPVPRGQTGIYIVCYGANVAGATDDSLDFDGNYSRVTRDVHVYGPRAEDGGGDVGPVNDAAERIRALFRRERLALSGGSINLSCKASPPLGNDGEHHFGRVVSVDLLIAEPAVV